MKDKVNVKWIMITVGVVLLAIGAGVLLSYVTYPSDGPIKSVASVQGDKTKTKETAKNAKENTAQGNEQQAGDTSADDQYDGKANNESEIHVFTPAFLSQATQGGTASQPTYQKSTSSQNAGSSSVPQIGPSARPTYQKSTSSQNAGSSSVPQIGPSARPTYEESTPESPSSPSPTPSEDTGTATEKPTEQASSVSHETPMASLR